MNFSVRRVRAIFRKELNHILRDPFTLAFAIGMPVLMLVFFGLAIDFNVKNVRISYFDADRGPKSRELIRIFESSGYFRAEGLSSPGQAVDRVQAEQDKAAVIIESRFDWKVRSGQSADVQVLLDGADNTTAGIVVSYLGALRQSAEARLYDPVPGASVQKPWFKIRTRFLFNPELNSRWFIVPGLAVVIAAILSILLTALTVAREWENGSMELLLSTPVTPLEIVIGKIAPYTLLGMFAFVLVYLTARLGFGLPFRGNHLLFGLGALLFLSCYLSQGLLISVVLRVQQLSMQVAMLSGLLPSLLLSGFIFPIENMPLFFRIVTAVLPARWFMVISRGTFLKNSSFFELLIPFTAMLVVNALLVAAASHKFKRDLEP